MKKSLLLVIGCLITTVSVNASQFYTDENTQYDSVHFLMLDEQNKPLTGLLEIPFDEWKIHKEINYVNGKKDGIETWYWPNGNKRFIVHWKNGKREGTITEFREDGTKSQLRTYHDNELDGDMIVYHFNGQEKTAFEYKDGHKHRKSINYETGKKAIDYTNQDDVKAYYQNGKLKYHIKVDKIKKTAVRILYYRTGEKALELISSQNKDSGYFYSLTGKKTPISDDKTQQLLLVASFGFFSNADDNFGELTKGLKNELF